MLAFVYCTVWINWISCFSCFKASVMTVISSHYSPCCFGHLSRRLHLQDRRISDGLQTDSMVLLMVIWIELGSLDLYDWSSCLTSDWPRNRGDFLHTESQMLQQWTLIRWTTNSSSCTIASVISYYHGVPVWRNRLVMQCSCQRVSPSVYENQLRY